MKKKLYNYEFFFDNKKNFLKIINSHPYLLLFVIFLTLCKFRKPRETPCHVFYFFDFLVAEDWFCFETAVH